MIYGELAIDDAVGARLAHGLRTGTLSLRKGHILSATDRDAMRAAGIATVIGVRLEDGDIGEDEAAGLISASISAPYLICKPPATGRANVHATANGLFVVDRAAIDRFNRIDPAITIATLPDHARVCAGDMVATIKIIPLAIEERKARRAAAELAPASVLQVKPFRAHRVGLVATVLPTLKHGTMDKTRRLLEQRLAPSASHLTGETRVAHRTDDLADAIRAAAGDNDIVIVFGASAVADPNDVIPSAIRAAGGCVEHLGMPVDPGNLLVLGSVAGIPVVGAPGCARSPKDNGFDWVLARIFAGDRLGSQEITGMGVGGLLAEISGRPRPRDADRKDGSVTAAVIVLAAGLASRMNGSNKLLAVFEGEALVRRVARAALAANSGRVLVVTGHMAEQVEAELDGLSVTVVRNDDHAEGMSTSLQAGIAALSPDVDGAVIMLGDMPGVTGDDVRRLIDNFALSGGRAIVRAVGEGKRGNPVLLPKMAFAAIRHLEGDVGARHIVENSGFDIIDVEIGTAALVDVDTPEAVLAAGGVIKSQSSA